MTVNYIVLPNGKVTAQIINAKNQIIDTVTRNSRNECEIAVQHLMQWLYEKGLAK
jgi:hypothetical protein